MNIDPDYFPPPGNPWALVAAIVAVATVVITAIFGG